METPQQTFHRRSVVQTPYYSDARSRRATPKTFRLEATTPKFGRYANGAAVNFEDILKKQWKIFSLSPLFRFKNSPLLHKKYSRSLDAAFCKVVYSPLEDTSVKCIVNPVEGLSAGNGDPEAVKIQVVEKLNEGLGKPLLTALLLCIDLEPDDHPVTPDLRSEFTYYPIMLVNGSQARAQTLIQWLEMHFDCNVEHLSFNNEYMKNMLGVLSTNANPTGNSKVPVLMQYCLSNNVIENKDISTISCKIDSHTCKEFWERLSSDVAPTPLVDTELVRAYVAGLEGHLEHHMAILFSKLKLSEVGTPLAYISHLGKMKILSKHGVYLVLKLICDFSRTRLINWKM